MTQTEAQRALIAAFSALPERDKDRLAYHYDKETPILCGPKWQLYADGDGGA